MSKPRNAKPQTRSPAATTLQARFNQGVALHQQGRLAEAEQIYRMFWGSNQTILMRCTCSA
jgi:hypothetical protein